MDDVELPPDGPADGWGLDAFWRALVECRNDLTAVLRVVADQVVRVVGDGCVLTTVTPDGEGLEPRAVVHRDPDVAAAMDAALGAGVRIGEGVAGTVAADRRPMVLNDMPPDAMLATVPERFAPFLRAHPVRALMIVPLVAGGELVGTLGAVRTRAQEPYSLADLRVLEGLAERAALALAEALHGPRAIGASDYEAVFAGLTDGVVIATPDGHILAANEAACAILRSTEAEVVAGGRESIVVAEDPRLARLLAERTASGRARSELTLRRGDGAVFVADASTGIYSTADGKARAWVVFRDVTEEVEARQRALARVTELAELAERDDLTGLWNRRGFTAAAQHALATADRAGATSHLLFVDIDCLKRVNDVHGHAAGDAAIVAMAAAIRASVRDVDVAGRLAGDEFLVLLVDTGPDDVGRIVERMQAHLAADPETPPELGFSTGLVERPPRLAATLGELVDAADRDMYQQKVLGRLRR